MSKLHFTYFFLLLFGLRILNSQTNNLSDLPGNSLAEYISTGEINLQWNSDKEVIIIASPRRLKSSPNKKAYNFCTKFGQGASFEDGYIVYKGKKSAIIVSGLEMGQNYYFTSYTANQKGVFNVPGPALTSFVAWSLGLRAEINIKAATSSPDQHFIIERSLDGINWDVLTNINASQELYGIVTYNYIDNGPLNGYYLYRLKQFNNNIQITSQPTPVETFSFAHVFEALQTQDDSGSWWLVSDTDTQLSITNALGHRVKQISLTSKNDFSFEIDDLPSGLYNVNGFNSNGEMNSKIIVYK